MRFIHSALLLWLALLSLPAAAIDYRLGSGDIVRITVYDHPELQMDARVDEQGKINFPLIGAVTVAGETLSSAQTHMENQLSKGGFLKNPQVNLIVTQYRSKQVSVLGQVSRPGKYPLESTSTVTDLLDSAIAFLSIKRRVDERGLNPLGLQRVHLIFHQSDQR